MRKMRVAGVAVVWLLLAGSAWAGVGVTLKAGTLGLGADLTLPIMDSNLNVRAGYNGGNLGINVDLDQAMCEGDIEMKNIPVLLDWHPAGGDFRISGGIIVNNNEVKLSAKPKEDFDLNGNSYPITGLTGSITFDQLAWYVGIGSGNAAGGGRVHFACDVGLMFQHKPTAEATATAAIPALQGTLDADLQAEVAEFQRDTLDRFILYPVISVGISFTFF